MRAFVLLSLVVFAACPAEKTTPPPEPTPAPAPAPAPVPLPGAEVVVVDAGAVPEAPTPPAPAPKVDTSVDVCGGCPAGQVCGRQTAQCKKAPCPSYPACIPAQTAVKVDACGGCRVGTHCVHQPDGWKCEENPIMDMGKGPMGPDACGGCAKGERCELKVVQCVKAPCPPIPECVPVASCDPACGADETCKLVAVQCKKGPCPPQPECVKNR